VKKQGSSISRARPHSTDSDAPLAVDFLISVFPSTLVVAVLFLETQGQFLVGTFALEFGFFASAAIISYKRRRTFSLLVSILVGYFVVRLYWAVDVMEAPIEDFIRSHKWVLYLAALLMFVGYRGARVDWFIKGTKALVALVFAKYLFVYLSTGGSIRPTALTENNYELALLAGFIVIAFDRLGRYKFFYLFLFTTSVALSGSRSGAITLVVIFTFLIFTSDIRSKLSKYLLSLATIIPFSVVAMIFVQRAQNSTGIDRLNFLGQFLYNVQSWGFDNWLFGTPPITQLASATCQDLSTYASLLSSDQSGGCYSVILHIFLLRVIFDSGILGLLLILGTVFYALRRSGLQNAQIIILITIALINSSSVSGFNNVYVSTIFVAGVLYSKSERNKSKSFLQSVSSARHRFEFGG